MKKGVVIFLIFALVAQLAYSISIKDLISRYIFSTATAQMNITSHTDLMIDRNNNNINDTLVIELTANSTKGDFIFIINLFDKNGILVNETNKTLISGLNKLNITFNSIFLTQDKFNYSIKIYNSSYSLKYRKDNILTKNYLNYEEGFRLLDIKDSKANKKLQINVTINSSVNGTFEVMAFLAYNNSIISVKENKSIFGNVQNLILNIPNETVKRTHYTGSFNISSVKFGKKVIKTNFTTNSYNFMDFAASSYISNFTDNKIDINGDNKYDILQINVTAQILANNHYTLTFALYDLFSNVVEIKNISYFLSSGKNTAPFDINGSIIYNKKLNGPFIVKYIELYENGTLIDKINDAYTTSNYNFNEFEHHDLPDLIVNITASDGYLYGISNVTINFTIKNIGKKHSFNIFSEIFDNKTFFESNKSNMLEPNSKITHQFNFANISDFEISAIVDMQNFIEELNESNNAERVFIKLNKQPNLTQINNVIAEETDKIVINASASDPNNDALSFSINLSKFSNNSNVFEWNTTTIDSGNYTAALAVSDGFLNDSSVFKIVILDAPEKDADNDGINDSIDRLIGDENSVNTSTVNVTILLGNSRNLSRVFNESLKVEFMDNNLTIAEFNFNFSLYKLNLTNLTINKQSENTTGWLLVKGLKMPKGTKTLYLDKIDTKLNGICIKEYEISSIDEMSSACSLDKEFKAECDGTLQNSYKCTYNSSSNKYKVEGLKHSGLIQIAYTKSSESTTEASASASAASSGGGGGVTCVPSWQCAEWSECIDGIKSRKCIDKNQCAFPAKKPTESEQCSIFDGIRENVVKPILPIGLSEDEKNGKKKVKAEKAASITGFAVNIPKALHSFIFDVFAMILALAMVYLAVISFFLKNV